MRPSLIFALSLFIAACGIPHSLAAGANEDPLLRIEAGRLNAMLDQVSALLKAKTDDTALADSDIDSEVRTAANRYNSLLSIACSRSVLVGPPCGDTYAPRALSIPASDRLLREEIEDATSRIYPFWIAVCAKLDDDAHSTCQME
jgi:hypothetical protein